MTSPSFKDRLNQDIKTALLAGDKELVSVLKGLKTAIQYAEVAKDAPVGGLDDAGIIQVFTREAKKRQDSADLYRQNGQPERAEAEEQEKKIIYGYLPAQLSEADVQALVAKVVAELDNPQMGQVIGAVKAQAGASADGATIARLVKQALGN